MDKNTIFGLVLIFVILITFSYLNKPSKQEVEARRKSDSIALVESEKAKQAELQQKNMTPPATAETIVPGDTSRMNKEEEQLKSIYGVFAESSKGTEKFITLENNLMKVRISTLGGKIYSVELKGYKRFNGQPLVLFEGNKPVWSEFLLSK
jgi:YidC/Oxa1 family membrane protein insertase